MANRDNIALKQISVSNVRAQRSCQDWRFGRMCFL